jgi:Kef-type K+ transport system membrane component KefB
MGRIPKFSNTIFPTESLAPFTLVANIGLVFFLFIVGMEVDFKIIKRNVKSSVIISVAGLVIPLGLGAALAVPLYHEFVSPAINYGYFILFVAVAIGITVRHSPTLHGEVPDP